MPTSSLPAQTIARIAPELDRGTSVPRTMEPRNSVPRNILDRLRSLADETRVRILLLLDGNELTVGEICQVVQAPQSTISRHLGILLNEAWLTVRVDGTSRHYRFSRELDAAGRQLWDAVRDDLMRTATALEDRTRATSILQARAERARAFFALEASRWDHLKSRLFGEGADLQLLSALLEGTEVVGDLGCGTGRLAELVAPFAGRVIGVDRSPEMLQLARERLAQRSDVDLRQGELESLPVESGSLDVAILSLVLHYVADPAKAIQEVHRCLRPGGRVLLLDMQEHDRSTFREEMGHLWQGFSPLRIRAWMEAAGFTAVSWSAVPPHPEATGPLLFALRGRRAPASPCTRP